MKRDKYLVSFCIPTYNRFEYLKKSLESIVTQKEFQKGFVEIVVSDNHSDDGTDELCREYAVRFGNFKYYRNERTIGADDNQANACRIAQGQLLKLSNDTLIYDNGSLEKICAVSREYEKSRPFIFLINNNSECRGAYTLGEYLNGAGGNYNFEEFLYNISYWITSIGNYAFWDDDYRKYDIITNGFETNLRQVILACNILEERNDSVIISDNIYSNQPVLGKNVSYGLFKVFYTNYLKILNSFYEKGDFSSECFDFVKRDIIIRFFPIWVVRQEFNKGEVKFAENENLKQLVSRAAKDSGCYRSYVSQYIKIKRDFIYEDFKRKLYTLMGDRVKNVYNKKKASKC